MVSRSLDGELLIPSLHVCRVTPVRGSTRSAQKNKGGQEALQVLSTFVHEKGPVLLTVDGPRGPRGHVHRGIVALAQNNDAVIIPMTVVLSKRWVLNTWDRLEVPKPFAKVYTFWGCPIDPASFSTPTACKEYVAVVLAENEKKALGSVSY
jgi:lysophospholipid acyltransferase (LPLAT)-like uncharacterized protein